MDTNEASIVLWIYTVTLIKQTYSIGQWCCSCLTHSSNTTEIDTTRLLTEAEHGAISAVHDTSFTE